jgi:hypothetical protein
LNSDKLIIGALISGILVVYTAIVFGFFGAEGDSRVIYLLLIGLPLALSFFMAPKIGLIVLTILIYSIDWVSETWGVIPREGTWLIDILVFMFIVRAVVTMPWRTIKANKIEIWIYIALLFAFVSAIINGESRATTMIGIRLAFKYLLLFIAIYHLDLSRKWVHGYLKILWIIALIQPAVVILQWRLLNWDSFDDMAGTFGNGQTPGIALFLLILISLLLARVIEKRKYNASMLLIVIWFTIAVVLGEAKFYFLILPLLLLMMLRAEFFKRPAIAIGISVFGTIFLVSADYAIRQSGYWMEGRNPLTYVTKLGEVYEKELDETRSNRPERLYRLASATRLAAVSPRDFFVGNGPGAITYSFVAEIHSKAMSYFQGWGLSSSGPSLAWLLIEYGYLGTFILLFPIWLVYRRGRVLRRSDDEELRIYGRWIEGMAFLFGVWMVYAPVMQLDGMCFIFWGTAAMLVRFSDDEENRLAMKETMERIEEVRQPAQISRA